MVKLIGTVFAKIDWWILGLNSEFWCLFINMFSIIGSVVSQTAFTILPGRNPVNIYVCMGQNPSNMENEPSKKNYLMGTVLFISMLWYIFACARMLNFRKKLPPAPVLPNSQNSWTMPMTSNQLMEKEALANFGTIALTIAYSIPITYLYWSINNMSPSKLASHPYFMILHVFHHGIGLYSNAFLLLIFLSQSKKMRAAILREISERCLGRVQWK